LAKRRRESDTGSSGGSAANWVQCDGCGKWRRLPSSVSPASLPKRWYCKLNRWTRYNSCSLPEEGTAPSESPARRLEKADSKAAEKKGKKVQKEKDVQRKKEKRPKKESDSSSDAEDANSSSGGGGSGDAASSDDESIAALSHSYVAPPLPFHVSKSLSLIALGRIVADRPAYHNDRYIFPVGYKSVRQYASMADPQRRCLYVSEIVDGGAKPLFRVTCIDAPDDAVTSDSCSGAWSIVLRRVDGEKNNYPINGPIQFGLTNPIVRQLIEAVPHARKCKKYVFNRGGAKALPLPPQPAFTPAQLEEEDARGLVPPSVIANFAIGRKKKKGASTPLAGPTAGGGAAGPLSPTFAALGGHGGQSTGTGSDSQGSDSESGAHVPDDLKLDAPASGASDARLGGSSTLQPPRDTAPDAMALVPAAESAQNAAAGDDDERRLNRQKTD
jgi:hypothetical protein